ncbi:MAG: hypothetical protein ACJAWV_001266 [Flammeovirgaceae bacterium]|jgi:hypothetical protein
MKIFHSLILLALLCSCQQKNDTKEVFSESEVEEIKRPYIPFFITVPFKEDTTYQLTLSHNPTRKDTELTLSKGGNVIDRRTYSSYIVAKGGKFEVENFPQKLVVENLADTVEVGVVKFVDSEQNISRLIVGRANEKLIKMKFLPNRSYAHYYKYKIDLKDSLINLSTSRFFIEDDSLVDVKKEQYTVLSKRLLIKVNYPTTDTLFSYQFKKDTSLYYHILTDKKTRIDDLFYAILSKESRVIDQHKLKPVNYSNLYVNGVFKKGYQDIGIPNIDELGMLSTDGIGEAWDGYGFRDMLFGVSNGKLINEVYIKSQGYNIDFINGIDENETFIILSKNSDTTNLIVQKKVYSTHNSESKPYYSFVGHKKYNFSNYTFSFEYDSLYRIAKVKEGLTVRSLPGLVESPIIGKTAYLDTVLVLQKSEVPFTLKESNGKTVEGYWCKMYYAKGLDSIGYVFDGYLENLDK